MYNQIVVPPAVVDELNRGRSLGIDLPDVLALPWLTIRAPEGLENVPTASELGAGEREVLALGTRERSVVVILDDRLGRLHAAALKLTFTGTLGLLLRAKAEGRIALVRPLLERLDHLGFRVSAMTYQAVLKQAGE